MTWLLANSPIPGQQAPIALLSVRVLTTPAPGTVETWTLNQAAGADLQDGQFVVTIDTEFVLVTAGQDGNSWTVTRGAEGSATGEHIAGTPLFNDLTRGALEGYIAQEIVIETDARMTADALLQPLSAKNQPNGYPGLDGSGLINPAQIPGGGGGSSTSGTKSIMADYGAVGSSDGSSRIPDTLAWQNAISDLQLGKWRGGAGIKCLLVEAQEYWVDPVHFVAVNFTANITSGSNVLTDVSSFASISYGAKLVGPDIPANAIVQSFSFDGGSVTMGFPDSLTACNATANHTGGACTTQPVRLDISGQDLDQVGFKVIGLGNDGDGNSLPMLVWAGGAQSGGAGLCSGAAIFWHSTLGSTWEGVMVTNSDPNYDGFLVAWAGNGSVGDVQFCTWDAPLRAGGGATPRALIARNGVINCKFPSMNLFGGYDGMLDGFYDGVYPPKYNVNNEYSGTGNANLQDRAPFRSNSGDIENYRIKGFSAEGAAQGQAAFISMAPWSLVTTSMTVENCWSGDTTVPGGVILDLGPTGTGAAVNAVRNSFTTPLSAQLGRVTATSGSNVLTAGNGSFVVSPRAVTFPDFGLGTLFPEGSIISKVTGSSPNQSVTLLLPICEGDVVAGSTTVTNLQGQPFPFVGDGLYGCLNFNGANAITDGTTIVSENVGPPVTLTLSAPALITAQAVTFYVQAKALMSETSVRMRGGSYVRFNETALSMDHNSIYVGFDVTVYQSQASASLLADTNFYSDPEHGRLFDGNFSSIDQIRDNGVNTFTDPLRGARANSVPFVPAGTNSERWGIGGTTGPVVPGVPTILFDDGGNIMLTPNLGEEVKMLLPEVVGTATLGTLLGTADAPNIESSTLINGNGTFTVGDAIIAGCLFPGTTITGVTGANPNKVISLSQPTIKDGTGYNVTKLSTTAAYSGAFADGMVLFGEGLPPLGVTASAVTGGTMTLSQAVGFDGVVTLSQIVVGARFSSEGFALGGLPPSPPSTITGSTTDNGTLQVVTALAAMGILKNSLVQPPSTFDTDMLAWITAHGGAYWWQGEASGTTAHDLGPNAHDAALQGTYTLGLAGIGDLTTAIAYDGTTGCAVVPSSGIVTQMCKDPTFDHDTLAGTPITEWSSTVAVSAGATLTIVNAGTTAPHSGTQCLEVACSAQFQGVIYQLALTIGQPYTYSVWIKGVTGSENVFYGLIDTGGSVWGTGSAEVFPTTGWTKFTVTGTPANTAQATGRLAFSNHVPGAATWYLDDCGILPPGVAFFSGDSGLGYAWTGTAGDSTSTYNADILLQPVGAFTAIVMGNPLNTANPGMLGLSNMDTGYNHGWALGASPGSVAAYLSSAGHRLDTASGGPLTAGAFQMLAMTFDGTSTLTAYKDAVSVAVNTGAHPPDYSATAMTIGSGNGSLFWAGRCPKGALITGVALDASDLAALLAAI